MNSLISLSPSPLLETIREAIENDPRLPSSHSRRQYRSDLERFEAWRDGRPMTKSLVDEYTASLQKAGYSPRTIRQHQAAIRWWARKIIDLAEERADDETAARIAKQAARITTIRDVKGTRPPRGRYLSPDEVTALIAVCSTDTSGPDGTRDAAMIAVAVSVGLRRDDLTTLKVENIRNVTEDSCDLAVHGKGDRVDILYLYNGGFRRLMDWLGLRGSDPGRVFCQVRKNGRINTRGSLSGEALRKILDARQMGLGLPEHITWHDFRKTFICRQLDEGNDLSTTQKNARHASPATTANIYDIRGENVRRESMKATRIGE